MKQGRMLSRSEELMVLIGLAVQPFVAGLAAFLLFPLINPSGRAVYEYQGARMVIEHRTPDVVDAARSVALAVGLVAVPLTALVALPSLAWLLKRGPITITQTLVAGAASGNIPLVVGFILISLRGPRQSLRPNLPADFPTFPEPSAIVQPLYSILFASAIGIVSAIAFWLIAGRRLGEPAATPPALL